MFDRDRRRQARHRARSAPARTTSAKWTRGDSIALTRNDELLGREAVLPDRHAEVLQGPDRAQQRAADRAPSTSSAPCRRRSRWSSSRATTSTRSSRAPPTARCVLSFNNVQAPLSDLQARQAVRYAIDHKALLDTCWAGRGELIGSMVPPTDPWYEDLHRRLPVRPGARPRQLLQESGASRPDRCGCGCRRCRTPTPCGQVVKSQLEQVGFTVELDQLEFPAAWLTTVFKNADYDMSIIAPRRAARHGCGVRRPEVLHPLRRPGVRRPCCRRPTRAPRRSRSSYMKQAARQLSEDAAADWLFLLPNLIVADEGHHRPAEERHLRVLRPDRPRRGPDRSGTRDATMLLRVLQRTRRPAGQPARQLGARVRVHGGAARGPRPGRARRQRLRRGGGRSCAASSGSTGRSSRSTSTGCGGLLRFDLGTSYVSRAAIGAADRRPAPGHAVAGRRRDGHRAASSRCRSAR